MRSWDSSIIFFRSSRGFSRPTRMGSHALSGVEKTGYFASDALAMRVIGATGMMMDSSTIVSRELMWFPAMMQGTEVLKTPAFSTIRRAPTLWAALATPRLDWIYSSVQPCPLSISFAA